MTLVESNNTQIIDCLQNIFDLLIGSFCTICKILDVTIQYLVELLT